MAVNLKVNAEIVERSHIRRSNVKIEEIKMAVITVVSGLEGLLQLLLQAWACQAKLSQA